MVYTFLQTTEIFQLLLSMPLLCCRVCLLRSCRQRQFAPKGWLCWLRCASAVFLLAVAGPMMLGIMAGMQMDSCSDMCSAGIAGDNAPRAVFFLLVCRPMMLGIMAGMVQMDSCSGTYGRLCWLRCTSRPFSFPGLQAYDALHHGRSEPTGHLQWYVPCCVFLVSMHPRAVFPWFSRPMLLGIMTFMDQKNTFARLWSRQCKLSGMEVPAVPQLQFFEGRHHPCRRALASHGPDCSSDHRGLPSCT